MEASKDTATEATARAAAGTFVGRRVHLIGVGGAGMRALAQMLVDRRAAVSGTDAAPSAAVAALRRRGAAVGVGHGADKIPPDCELVVRSAAIHEDNPELQAARRRGLDVIKYAEMLGRLMAEGVGVAVAGTHGKSTTAAMVAYALWRSGADPSYVIGAHVEQLGGPSGVGGGRHFVAEACEFDRSFLHLRPQLAAILNVEEDHLDCYRDLDEIVEAFGAFASQVAPSGVVIVNADDAAAARAARSARAAVEGFGRSAGCAWRAADVAAERGCREMDVLYRDRPLCRFRVPLPGAHNADNALAAAALLHHAGLTGAQIADALARFGGAQRRMTLKGRARGVTVLDDYAHHPTEIRATLRAVREHFAPRRLLCVFQPHQHSRTRFLLKDFAGSFAACDQVIVPDIYFVRDSERERDYISSRDLVAQIGFCGRQAAYRPTFEQIGRHLRAELREGDLVVTMGAGDIWKVADDVVRWLGADR
jgi:UDP-N-acetylmuramate--alanine ligase